jgi:hypothetical protein
LAGSAASIAMLGRAMMAAGWHVAADHLAKRLGLFPADIAFMGVRHERQPIGTCLPPRFCLWRPASRRRRRCVLAK